MQLDFHYYATYCAAFIAGYSHEDALSIAYADQFTDCCTRTFLKKVGGPSSAATTQFQLELMDARTDMLGLQDITRIWSSFHFLPRDLYAEINYGTKAYKNRYRLICGPNGALLEDTVKLAHTESLPSVGLAMHILSDTWAHTYFAGTPSIAINNTNGYFYECMEDGSWRHIKFRHNPVSPDNSDSGHYTSSIYQISEFSIMNLGHGRAGHLPDYSYCKYKYLPAWGRYEEIIKDNPKDYYSAFCQMVYAMKCIREGIPFEKDKYAFDEVSRYKDSIEMILIKRQIDACEDWKNFGESLSGNEIEDFDSDKYISEYMSASDKAPTYLGKYFLAAMSQKSMVTNRIFASGNLLAGLSVDYKLSGFKGIKDFKKLIDEFTGAINEQNK